MGNFLTTSRSNIFSKLQIFLKNTFHSNWSSYLVLIHFLINYFTALTKFWMLQMRKSCSCWISAIFFQCCFMIDMQVFMTVSYFSEFFSRNKFLVWGFTFQWMIVFELGDAPWGDFEKNHRMGESPDSPPPTPLPLFPLLNLQTDCKESDFSVNSNNIKIFYTQTLSNLLKITKFLVKILSLNS